MPHESPRLEPGYRARADADYAGRVSQTWEPGAYGVMALPSGRLVRGRGLRIDNPYKPDPEFAVYVVGSDLYGVTWDYRWVDWPDYGLPANPAELRERLSEALARSSAERVEVGCTGGRGRTGTALACLAVLDGLPAADAVAYVTQHYSPDAVETLDQASFAAHFR
jgi:hypothetical protein